MDEPLSNLDAKMRVQMRAEIARIQRDLKVTTIYVTHDQSEAMTLGDRVCVMRGGVLQQVASPQDALRPPGEPVRRGLHRLAGDEPRRGGRSPSETAASSRASARTSSACRREVLAARPAPARLRAAGAIALGIRPEDVEDAPGPGRRAHHRHGRHPRGHGLGGLPPLRARRARREGRRAPRARRRRGGRGGRGRRPTTTAARSSRRSRRGTTAREGEQAVLTLNTHLLHFFSLETGEAI